MSRHTSAQQANDVVLRESRRHGLVQKEVRNALQCCCHARRSVEKEERVDFSPIYSILYQ